MFTSNIVCGAETSPWLQAGEAHVRRTLRACPFFPVVPAGCTWGTAGQAGAKDQRLPFVPVCSLLEIKYLRAVKQLALSSPNVNRFCRAQGGK